MGDLIRLLQPPLVARVTFHAQCNNDEFLTGSIDILEKSRRKQRLHNEACATREIAGGFALSARRARYSSDGPGHRVERLKFKQTDVADGEKTRVLATRR